MKKNLEKKSKERKGEELFKTKKRTEKTEIVPSKPNKEFVSKGETVIEIAPEFNDFPNKKDV